MSRRLLGLAAALAVLLAGTATLGTVPRAQAAWTLTTLAAPAAAKATTMPAALAPTVKGTNLGVLGYSYTLTWPSTPLVNGYPVSGYIVSRTTTAGGGGTVLANGSCAGTNLLGLSGTTAVPSAAGPTQTCTENSTVMLSGVMYRITPVAGNWRGTPSAWVTPT